MCNNRFMSTKKLSYEELFKKGELTEEIILSDSPLSIFKHIKEEEHLNLIKNYVKMWLVCNPSLLEKSLVKAANEKVIVEYKFSNEEIKIINVFRDIYNIKKSFKTSPYNDIGILCNLLYKILAFQLGWTEEWIRQHVQVDLKKNIIQAITRAETNKEIEDTLTELISHYKMYYSSKCEISDKQIFKYLQKLKYIKKDFTPLQPRTTIEKAIIDILNGAIPKKCIFCDEVFLASKPKQKYHSPSCRVLHFHKRKFIGQKVPLSGKEAVIKEIKKTYAIVEIKGEKKKVELIFDKKTKAPVKAEPIYRQRGIAFKRIKKDLLPPEFVDYLEE